MTNRHRQLKNADLSLPSISKGSLIFASQSLIAQGRKFVYIKN